MYLNFMTFQISVLDNFYSILIQIFFGGWPPKSPRKKFKNLKIWKVTHVTPYNTQFVLKKSFCAIKTRMFAKKQSSIFIKKSFCAIKKKYHADVI